MFSPDRSRKLVLSPRARQDFIDILRYTGVTWGQGQLHTYRDQEAAVAVVRILHQRMSLARHV